MSHLPFPRIRIEKRGGMFYVVRGIPGRRKVQGSYWTNINKIRMSNKINAYAGRRSDKNISRNTSHGHSNLDDKRPSVFDRLGVRRDVSSGSYSHGHHQERQESQGFNKRTDHKSNTVRQIGQTSQQSNIQMTVPEKKRSYNRDRDSYRGRSRSHSSSPKRKNVTSSSVPHNKRKVKGKAESNYQSDGNYPRKYTSSPRRDSEPFKSKQQRVKAKGQQQKKNKKAKKDKSNARSSSVSSDSSSGGNSSSSGSSGSQSGSSSYSDSSSSSTSDSSSSDSSVPSIKLKPEKKSKNRKKCKDKIKNKSIEKSGKKPAAVSSASSIDPHDDNMKVGTHTQWAGHRRDKQTGKDIVPQPDDKLSTIRDRDTRKDRYQRDYQEEPLKRKLPGGAYEPDTNFKRSRMTPPQTKVKTAPLRSSSPRRAPPPPANTPLTKMKIEGSPGPGGARDRLRLLRTPPRRPPAYEDSRKVDIQKEKPISSSNLVRARDMDYESMQHSSRPLGTDRYDKSGYKREDVRPRERIAPNRNPVPVRKGRFTPETERDKMKEMPKEYEIRKTLLSTPTSYTQMHDRNKSGMGMRLLPPMDDDRRIKTFQNEPFRRHSPLLAKTKEELSEKYDELKLSRVDMWVDETLKGSTAKTLIEKAPPLKKVNLEKKSTGEDSKEKDKCSSIGSSLEKVKADVDLGDKEEQFSDFSDDADEILNKEVDAKLNAAPKGTDEPVSTKTEKIVEPVESINKSVKTDAVNVDNAPVEKAEKEKPVLTEQTFIKFRDREQKMVPSLRSQSQTEDDILEAMGFEEISDEEFGEVENKIGIVDALGVDWTSLVCCEKNYEPSEEDGKPSHCKVRQRWKPLEIIKQIGVSKKHLGEELTKKIADKLFAKDGCVEDFGFPKASKEKQYDRVLEKFGLGPNSRALSSRRDMATRYCFMGLLPRNLLSLDLLRPTVTSGPSQENE